MSPHATLHAPDFADPALDAAQDPPAGHTGRLPPGLALAQWLRSALLTTDLAGPGRWSTETSHAFEIASGERRFDVTVARRDAQGRFEIAVETRRGLLPWARRSDPVGERTVCVAIDAACQADPRISDLRWTDVESWTRAEGPPAPALAEG